MSKSESEEMKLVANVGGRGMWVHSASHRAGGTRELPLSVGWGWARTTAGRGSQLSPQHRRWLSQTPP